jgi:hypothetical protein
MSAAGRHQDAILEMPVDSSYNALEDLDPISRALVELSVKQGLDDEAIASMLGNDAAFVRAQREEALRVVATRIAPDAAAAELPELQTAVADALGFGEDEPEADEDEVPDPLAAFIVPSPDEPAPEADDTPAHLHSVPTPDWLDESQPVHPRERHRPRSRRRIVLVVLAGVVAVAVIVGIQRSGGDDSKTPTPTPAPSASQPQQATTPKKVEQTKLAAVGNATATGTASLTDGRLRLNVMGLPDPRGGTYTVWLYNSVIDSRPIGTGKGTAIKLNAKLPADAKSFRYVDVSLEPADGNPNHSGDSVVRVALAKLGK